MKTRLIYCECNKINVESEYNNNNNKYEYEICFKCEDLKSPRNMRSES